MKESKPSSDPLGTASHQAKVLRRALEIGKIKDPKKRRLAYKKMICDQIPDNEDIGAVAIAKDGSKPSFLPDLSDYDKTIAWLNEIEELRKREEEERLQAKIGDMTLGEIISVIRSTIRDEANTGNLPILNDNKKKALKKWAWVCAGLVTALYGYRTLFATTEFSLFIDGGRLYISRQVDGAYKEYEIRLSQGSSWQVCNVGDNDCRNLVVPLSAAYNSRYNVTFLANGEAAWIEEKSPSSVPVRFIDGSWSHEDYDSESGWTAIDSHSTDSELDAKRE